MPSYTLFLTSHCHLCEQAISIIQATAPHIEICSVDITEHEKYFSTYGLRIPVIRQASSGLELDWPFNANDVLSFINKKASI